MGKEKITCNSACIIGLTACFAEMGSKKEKIAYISGKISGIPLESARANFDRGERLMLSRGYNVVNPLAMHAGRVLTWQQYMRLDISALVRCDTIYMLTGWHLSKGARLEHTIAKAVGIEIIYED